MTEINIPTYNRRRVGVARAKRHSLKTDMTPMVDLGFLLITFFVMTVQLSKPSVVDLNMTKDGFPVLLGNSNALTILLDKNDRVYYYEGDWKDASRNEKIFQTNFSANSGLRKVIQEKQQWLDSHDQKEGRKGLMLLIKAGNGSSYENLINSLDEALINVVEKYAVLSAEPDETAWMKKQQ
ncbi:MAG: biopolymer transporter ExbD [Bacteroidota bacterium]